MVAGGGGRGTQLATLPRRPPLPPAPSFPAAAGPTGAAILGRQVGGRGQPQRRPPLTWSGRWGRARTPPAQRHHPAAGATPAAPQVAAADAAVQAGRQPAAATPSAAAARPSPPTGANGAAASPPRATAGRLVLAGRGGPGTDKRCRRGGDRNPPDPASPPCSHRHPPPPPPPPATSASAAGCATPGRPRRRAAASACRTRQQRRRRTGPPQTLPLQCKRGGGAARGCRRPPWLPPPSRRQRPPQLARPHGGGPTAPWGATPLGNGWLPLCATAKRKVGGGAGESSHWALPFTGRNTTGSQTVDRYLLAWQCLDPRQGSCPRLPPVVPSKGNSSPRAKTHPRPCGPACRPLCTAECVLTANTAQVFSAWTHILHTLNCAVPTTPSSPETKSTRGVTPSIALGLQNM